MIPAHMPPASPDGGGLFSDEIATFRCFVSQLDYTPTTSTSSFAHLSVLVTTPQYSWIIDNGAFHHMTGMSSLFTSYHICFGKDKVRITDGFLSSIDDQGDIPTTSNLSLSFVLHVPNFTLNLLFISHITKNLNCRVTIFPSYCVFQDTTAKKNGLGHEMMVFTFWTLIR